MPRIRVKRQLIATINDSLLCTKTLHFASQEKNEIEKINARFENVKYKIVSWENRIDERILPRPRPVTEKRTPCIPSSDIEHWGNMIGFVADILAKKHFGKEATKLSRSEIESLYQLTA